MKTTVITLCPKAGWPAFGQSREVDALIDSTLCTDRKVQPWRYYSFTSCTSIWDRDELGDTCYLSASYNRVNHEQMEELTMTIGPGESLHVRELKDLRQRLIHEYAFEESIR